jgi:hypothetical protein
MYSITTLGQTRGSGHNRLARFLGTLDNRPPRHNADHGLSPNHCSARRFLVRYRRRRTTRFAHKPS